MTKLQIIRKLKDGSTEVQRPERRDGFYWVEIPIADEAEMERQVARGCSVRVRGETTGQWNLKKIPK